MSEYTRKPRRHPCCRNSITLHEHLKVDEGKDLRYILYPFTGINNECKINLTVVSSYTRGQYFINIVNMVNMRSF